MKYKEYKQLYDKLRNPKDIDRLAKTGLDRELLLVIYNQKVVRNSTRRFYEVKNISRKLLRKWRRGRSFMDIAREINFPPVLTAHLILKEDKMPRKKFWSFLSDTSAIRDKRLRRELEQVSRNDLVYSPSAMEKGFERGKLGEEKLFKWLEKRKIPFRTENQIKGEFPKTPDFLLGKPIKFNGSKRYWIESKASFGTVEEVRRNVRNQLKFYKELFGDGIVVYWFGFIEDIDLKVPEGVHLADDRFLRDYDRNA
jgi:hypothetical protein